MDTWYKVKIEWGYGSVTYTERHKNRIAALTAAMLDFTKYLIENPKYITELRISADFADYYKVGREEGAKE